MARFWSAVTLTAFALVLNGCGGSNSSTSSVNTGGGASSPQYTATLPDGSAMDIEVVDEGKGDISGSFAVAATTGPYALQAGEFTGTVVGDSVSMDCETSDGSTEFQMTGKQGSNGFQLTRSDIPGTLLTFTLEEPTTQFRANTSSVSTNCSLGSGGTSGKLTISTTPYSVQGGGVLTEYRGTYLGTPVTFWQYNTGQANLILTIDPLSLDSSLFSSLKLTDLPTVSATCTSSTLTTYSNITKSQFRTKHSVFLTP